MKKTARKAINKIRTAEEYAVDDRFHVDPKLLSGKRAYQWVIHSVMGTRIPYYESNAKRLGWNRVRNLSLSVKDYQ